MSGGQYSVYRAALGAWFVFMFARALSGAPPAGWGLAVCGGGIVASVLFAIGLRDRVFAVLMGAAFVAVCTPDPLTTALVLAPLVIHLTTTVAPYGSWDARGRPDPDGGFAIPRLVTRILAPAVALIALGLCAWVDVSVAPDGVVHAAPDGVVLGVGAVAFGVATPFPALRRWGFVASVLAVAAHIVLAHIVLAADAWSVPLLFVVLATFDPRFVPRSVHPTDPPEHIFYDGGCGLCHRAVRFVLAEDQTGDAFRFAALQGDTFIARVPEAARETVPDSIVVLTHDGRVLVRSRAVLHIMAGLGGLWRTLAIVLRVVPRPLVDVVYDGIARVRHRIFAKPKDVCPIIPKRLRPRFDP